MQIRLDDAMGQIRVLATEALPNPNRKSAGATEDGCWRSADEQDGSWLDLIEEIDEQGQAIINLRLGRLPILRRAAPHDVGAPIVVSASHPVRLHQRMQGTSGAADEALALGVLVGARGLADHQNAAGAAKLWLVWQHDLGAGGAEEFTFLASHSPPPKLEAIASANVAGRSSSDLEVRFSSYHDRPFVASYKASMACDTRLAHGLPKRS